MWWDSRQLFFSAVKYNSFPSVSQSKSGMGTKEDFVWFRKQRLITEHDHRLPPYSVPSQPFLRNLTHLKFRCVSSNRRIDFEDRSETIPFHIYTNIQYYGRSTYSRKDFMENALYPSTTQLIPFSSTPNVPSPPFTPYCCVLNNVWPWAHCFQVQYSSGVTVVCRIHISTVNITTNGMQALTESDSLPLEMRLEARALLLIVVVDSFVGKVTIEEQTNFYLTALTFGIEYWEVTENFMTCVRYWLIILKSKNTFRRCWFTASII